MSCVLSPRRSVADGADDEGEDAVAGQGVVLGDALASVTEAGVDVVACREERSEIEEAFLSLTGRQGS